MATSAERLRQYEDLFEQSQAYNPAQFQEGFERGYGETTDYNKDIIQQQSGALGRLQSAAPELRQRYAQSPIKDPTLQRSLIAQARQMPISDYGTAVGLLGQRGQRMGDIMGKALSGYQTSASQAQTAAENAWRMYQDAAAREEAERARRAAAAAASQQNSLAQLLQDILNRKQGNVTEETFEIPEEKYGTASLGDSNQDRLAKKVLEQRGAQSYGDLLKSYADTAFIEPYRNINSVGDVFNIPAKGIAGATTIVSDLFNRLRR
jgi:hypothetical protein